MKEIKRSGNEFTEVNRINANYRGPSFDMTAAVMLIVMLVVVTAIYVGAAKVSAARSEQARAFQKMAADCQIRQAIK